ncbi:MAG: putative exported protein [Labilithrix sp.]|nr:putative exported protein [Labilithrix sp.]
MNRAAIALLASLGAACVRAPSGADARLPAGVGLAVPTAGIPLVAPLPPLPAPSVPETARAYPLLATLVQTHSDERVPLDEVNPTQERFSALLADRVSGEKHPFDPKLLELLRALARRHAAARIELVSGYRSPKLNEMMRKQGRHVASHSQHSLGHAVDFRIVPGGETRGIDPRTLEKEVRDLGWAGGVGVYTTPSDWFVHCDVGRLRRWNG